MKTGAALLALALLVAAPSSTQRPVTGLSHAPALAAAYEAILDANFAAVPGHLHGACGTVPVFCQVMESVALWWRIQLDPDDRRHDREFLSRVESAISAAERWATTSPMRAEAWFAAGAAYGARAQWRVLRRERLAAARDGKRIKETLERALQLDPDLHDAKFGIGLYRYYADVAPAALRLLRWLLLLPGGDRRAGLAQMLDARERGLLVGGEAEFQLHQIYLWYEERFVEARAIIGGLADRYPRNPLFPLLAAEIDAVYFHDRTASRAALTVLITRSDRGEVNEPAIARRRAERQRAALDRRPSP